MKIYNVGRGRGDSYYDSYHSSEYISSYGIGLVGLIFLLLVTSTFYLMGLVEGAPKLWGLLTGLAGLVMGCLFLGYLWKAFLDRHPTERSGENIGTLLVSYILVIAALSLLGTRIVVYHFSLQSFEENMTAYIERGSKRKCEAAIKNVEAVKWHWWPKKLTFQHHWSYFWNAFKRAKQDEDLAMMRKINDYVFRLGVDGKGWTEAIWELRDRMEAASGDRQAGGVDKSSHRQADPEPESGTDPPVAELLPDSEPEPLVEPNTDTLESDAELESGIVEKPARQLVPARRIPVRRRIIPKRPGQY